jgi:hypothetical protein
MRKIHISLAAIVTISVFASIQQGLQSKSNGNIVGYAGAPKPGGSSEQTCANCHGGTINSGPNSVTISVQGNPAGFIPGQTYSVTASITNSTTPQAGFSLTCLDPSLANCGTFANGTGTRIVSDPQSGRFYINHSGTNLKTWTFSWTAPNLDAPDSVTFYAAAREASPNNIYTGKSVFRKQSVTSTIGVENAGQVSVYPNPALNEVRFGSLTVKFSIHNINGILVKQGEAKAGEAIDVSGLSQGTYLWQAFSGKSRSSGNFLKQ